MDPVGVSASWAPIEGAVEYVYALRYDGALRYDRVPGTSATIAVTPGLDVNLDVSAVFADGSFSAAVDCGTARTFHDTSENCAATSLEGAILVDYPSIDGAVSYVFALKVNGGPVFYNSVNFTSLKFDIGSGATGSTRITPVFADGSEGDAITCNSATAG